MITVICNIFAMLNVRTPDKPAGLFSSRASILQPLTGPDQRIKEQMPSPISITPRTITLLRNPSSLQPLFWVGHSSSTWAWQDFFKLLWVSISLSSGYHPQTKGQAERKRLWDTWDPTAMATSTARAVSCSGPSMYSLWQSTTSLTTFQCILGFQPLLFPWSGEPLDLPAVNHWF